MKQSEITLIEALSMLDGFAPIKISLNDIILYNDYDWEPDAGHEMRGETEPWQEVIMDRLWQAKDYVITDVNVKIVQYHHSIITLRGRYEPYKKDEC
jgi:hypothetical protein